MQERTAKWHLTSIVEFDCGSATVTKPIPKHMVYSKDKWVAAIKKAVTDLNTNKPTSGLPCAIAGLRYVRDELLSEVKPDDESAEAKFYRDTVKSSINTLIGALTKKDGKGVEDGFLSNASAAAKAAGFKAVEGTLNAVKE